MWKSDKFWQLCFINTMKMVKFKSFTVRAIKYSSNFMVFADFFLYYVTWMYIKFSWLRCKPVIRRVLTFVNCIIKSILRGAYLLWTRCYHVFWLLFIIRKLLLIFAVDSIFAQISFVFRNWIVVLILLFDICKKKISDINCLMSHLTYSLANRELFSVDKIWKDT